MLQPLPVCATARTHSYLRLHIDFMSSPVLQQKHFALLHSINRERCISINMNVHYVRINKYKLLVWGGWIRKVFLLFHCSALSHHQQLMENHWLCISDEEDSQRCGGGRRAIIISSNKKKKKNTNTCMAQPLDHRFLSHSVFLHVSGVTEPLHHPLLMSQAVKSTPAFPWATVSVPICHTHYLLQWAS